MWQAAIVVAIVVGRVVAQAEDGVDGVPGPRGGLRRRVGADLEVNLEEVERLVERPFLAQLCIVLPTLFA